MGESGKTTGDVVLLEDHKRCADDFKGLTDEDGSGSPR